MSSGITFSYEELQFIESLCNVAIDLLNKDGCCDVDYINDINQLRDKVETTIEENKED